MTEPTPLPEGTRDYLAVIEGQWQSVTVPVITSELFPKAQEAASAATRELLGIDDNKVEFHIVGNKTPDGRAYRSHWRLEAHCSGPNLIIGATEPHPSQVNLLLRVYPHSLVRQFVAESDWNDMPFIGEMAAIVPAMLLSRGLLRPSGWGVDPIELTLGDYGTGRFTPQQVVFRDMSNAPIGQGEMGSGRHFRIPIEQEPGVLTDIRTVVSYCFDTRFNQVRRPVPAGLWLVTEEDTPTAWKVSYCVDDSTQGPSQRWDLDPEHPEWDTVPAFEPLPWPTSAPMPTNDSDGESA